MSINGLKGLTIDAEYVVAGALPAADTGGLAGGAEDGGGGCDAAAGRGELACW